jgi:hypothetical protein
MLGILPLLQLDYLGHHQRVYSDDVLQDKAYCFYSEKGLDYRNIHKNRPHVLARTALLLHYDYTGGLVLY